MARLDHHTYHVPVMASECLHCLNPSVGGVFVDATFGGGGHSRLIVEAMPEGSTLVAFDADEFALQRAAAVRTLATQKGINLELIHANFVNIGSVGASFKPINGALFDLGVSSFQFDHHPRGFSYRDDAPLDMRFTPEGNTAADLVNTHTEQELTQMLRDYAQEPSARRIAQAIVRRRSLAPYKTTVDLRDTILQHIPPQHQAKTLARVFQALRIAVNKELENLSVAITSILPLMAEGGTVVVMSYHSLEDKIVKDVFKAHGSASAHTSTRVEILTRKPIMATPEEVSVNPRARSARLRAARVLPEHQ